MQRAEGLWQTCVREGNLQSPSPDAPLVPLTTARTTIVDAGLDTSRSVPAPAPPRVFKLDGDIGEWPWKDASRVGQLRITPGGDEAGIIDRFCAAADRNALLLAFEINHLKADNRRTAAEPYTGDGLEVSFRNANPGKRTPIYMLWLGVDGRVTATKHGGATAEQAALLSKHTTCRATAKAKGWNCELRIPFAGMGLTRADVSRLKFNVGSLHKNNGIWLIWTTAGGSICDVVNAGKLLLKRAGK